MSDVHSNGNLAQYGCSPIGSTATLEGIRGVQRALAEHGKQVALLSGDTEQRPEVIDELTRYAEATGVSFFLPAFDDSHYESDRIRSAECLKTMKDRERLEEAERCALADVKDRENKLARLQPGVEKPGPPCLLMFAAGFFLSLTVAPTLHDFIFISLPDDFSNWFASIASATVVAVVIVVGILSDLASLRRIHSTKGFIAVVVISVGLAVLRLSQASGVGEILFTAALTIIEIGLIVLLEWRATALRVAFDEWLVRNGEILIARAQFEVARSGLANLRERLREADESIASHIRYVEDRLFRHSTIDNIVKATVHSAISGYAAGTSANRGRSLGTKNIA